MTHAENARAWRERNPEKARQNWRAWRDRNPDKNRENGRAYRAKNRAAIAAKARARYAANQEHYKEVNRNQMRQTRELLIGTEKLRRGACIDCGLAVTAENIVVFDFDHRDRKTKRSGVSRTTAGYLVEEMAKCDLRCANCHRLKTWRENDRTSHREPVEPLTDTLF